MPVQLSSRPMLAPPSDILENAALFLDFDGTLVDIAATPDAVVVDRAIHDLLALLLERHRGAVAIISGRSIAQLDDLLGESARRVALSGSHGVERREGGIVTRPERPPELDEAQGRFHSIVQQHDGVVVEAKSYGVALHYRLAPQFAAEARSEAARLAAELGLLLQEGKMMVELRTPGDDKGMALRKLMQCDVMNGRRPIFLGDDVTDEVAFLAARHLGGHAILVGPPRETNADFALPSPAAARDWLTEGPQ
ncbi:MAG: trehalose-phosphatase [Pseudomonadota bacterium]|nr:trehalose-phosphatase [Pseudomonadota bacterium]